MVAEIFACVGDHPQMPVPVYVERLVEECEPGQRKRCDEQSDGRVKACAGASGVRAGGRNCQTRRIVADGQLGYDRSRRKCQMKRMCAALVLVLGLGASLIAQAPAADIVGSWDITTTSPISEQTNTMVISKDGESLKAVVKGDAGELPYDKIALKGSDVTIVLTIDYQ